MPEFSDINFKYTDAEEERVYAPELIKDAYVDIDGVLSEIESPEKFLVIGPKGSGKTALSTKMKLNKSSNLHIENDELEQFEFSLLDKTGGEKRYSIGGAFSVWKLILYIRILSLFAKDNEFINRNKKVNELYRGLVDYGLADSDGLIKIVQHTSRRGMFGKIGSSLFGVRGEKVGEEQYKLKDPAALVESIECVLKCVNGSSSSYYLILDGLDHILRNGRNNTQYIADLINASRSLNMFFGSIKLKAKIIILIRNEVLQIVPDPNLTKRINDNGIHLKWYDNTRSPFETSLLRIIENRAALVGFKENIEILWKMWMPISIHRRSSFDFIIRNTRFLPRDIISFFRELQKLDKKPPFNDIDVLSALNNYSDWFQQELSDALVGLINEELRIEMPNIITRLGKKFDVKDLKDILKEYRISSDQEAEQVVRELFNTSWIGNFWTSDKRYRYSWRHRKINAKLNLKHSIIVHEGLWKSLNLV